MYWHPGKTTSKRTALPSSHPELMVRFLKESSTTKPILFPDIDHLDLQVRQESLKARGEPCMLQLCVVPAYALTIHKTQALSIKHLVLGLQRVGPAC